MKQRPGTTPLRRRPRPDPLSFVIANTRLAPVRSLPEISIHTAHRASGLYRLGEPGEDGADPPAPYWAFAWAGGLVIARHVLNRPETVVGRRVLDLGAGSGLVGIAAMKSGARQAIAAEIDPYGVAAIGLNATANGVAITIVGNDVTGGSPPAVDLVLAGDVFYDREVGQRVLPFLDRCLNAGIEVLVGDPGRVHLPRGRLRTIAEYVVSDFCDAESAAIKPSAVFALEPAKP